MSRQNPALTIALGVVLVALGLVLPGTTRELILRVVGIVAIVAGAVMWLVARRR